MKNDLQLIYHNTKYDILDDTGFVNFDGIVQTVEKQIVRLTFTNGQTLNCTPDHLLMKNDLQFTKASSLKPTDIL